MSETTFAESTYRGLNSKIGLWIKEQRLRPQDIAIQITTPRDSAGDYVATITWGFSRNPEQHPDSSP